MAKSKRGRPAKPDNELKSDRAPLRYDQQERETFLAAARLSGLTLAAWMRTRLRMMARRELEEVGKTCPLDVGGK